MFADEPMLPIFIVRAVAGLDGGIVRSNVSRKCSFQSETHSPVDPLDLQASICLARCYCGVINLEDCFSVHCVSEIVGHFSSPWCVCLDLVEL